jgi:hypothetical protein
MIQPGSALDVYRRDLLAVWSRTEELLPAEGVTSDESASLSGIMKDTLSHLGMEWDSARNDYVFETTEDLSRR